MSRKKKYSATSKRKSEPVVAHGLMFMTILGICVFAVYLWGKVEIDFMLRDNTKLESVCNSLQLDVDDLRTQVIRLKSYERIVALAKQQGLDFVPASNLSELSVDLDGLTAEGPAVRLDLRYAGFALTGVKRIK